MSKAKNIDLKALCRMIREHRRFLIATHEHPDGDGIGSVVALGMGLKQLKKQVTLYIQDPVPRRYHYLPGQDQIRHGLKPGQRFDMSFIVDLGEIERVGEVFVKHPGRGITVSLDHHAKGVHNADYNFCLPKQASSGEVIYKVITALGVKINKAIATNIYTAMATDTGSFKYSNTTPETFAIAAELAAQGVDVWEVALHCFETYSLPRMNLLKRIIGRMEVHRNKKIAWIVLKQSDYKKTGTQPEDAEGFINFPRSIEGVEVAVAFKEQKGGLYKVSLRSKNYVDVATLALKFGGGGHMRASGFTVAGSLERVKQRVLRELVRLV